MTADDQIDTDHGSATAALSAVISIDHGSARYARAAPQPSDQACADLHGDTEHPPGDDDEFPNSLRDLVEDDCIDRHQRRDDAKECAGGAEQFDRIDFRLLAGGC